jgi:hypothetical protein
MLSDKLKQHRSFHFVEQHNLFLFFFKTIHPSWRRHAGKECILYVFVLLLILFSCFLKSEIADSDTEDMMSFISTLTAENSELKVITETWV